MIYRLQKWFAAPKFADEDKIRVAGRLNNLLGFSPDAITGVNENGEVTQVNKQAERYLPFAPFARGIES